MSISNLSMQVIETVLSWGLDDGFVSEAVGSCIAGSIDPEEGYGLH